MNIYSYRAVGRSLNKTACVLAFLALVCASARSQTYPELDQFFVQPNEDVEIHVPADYQPTTKYVLKDYQGTVVATGMTTAKMGDWFVPVKLPAGYYDLDFPDAERHFGLVAIPKYEGKPDAFFGMDAALSWLTHLPMRESLISILKRCGMGMVRERIKWPSLMQPDGTWDWEADRAYDETRRLYARYGLPLLEVAHESPKSYLWSDVGKYPLPDDLISSVRDWKVIGPKWAPYWSGIEAWNEPDGHEAPADQYTFWVKALRYALRQAGVKTPVGGGVLAGVLMPYMEQAAENGLMESSDFISFHYYQEPSDMVRTVAKYRQWLKKYGHESIPLWLTEVGSYWHGPERSLPSKSQSQTTALKLVSDLIEAKACGVEHVFPFVFVYYAEFKKVNFGMLDISETPTRSIAAYANAIRLLSNKPFIGDINGADGKSCARVFASDNGDAVMVFMKENIAPKATVALPFTPREVYGADGRSLKADAAVPVPDGLGFAVAPVETVRQFVSTNSPAFQQNQISRGAHSAPSEKICPIILKPQMKKVPVRAQARGYCVNEKPGKLTVPVRVTNLDSEAHNVQLEYRKNNGNSKKRIVAKVSSGIPAESSVELSAEIDFSEFPAPDDFRTKNCRTLKVVAKSNMLGKISPVVMNFMFEQGIDEYLAKCRYQYALPLDDENLWTHDFPKMTNVNFEHSPESRWGFSAEFTGDGRSFFPKLVIPKEAQMDRVTAVLIRGRMMKPGSPKVITWNDQNIQSDCNYPLFPADGKWHVVCLPLESFVVPPKGGDGAPPSDLGRQVKKISVGMSSREKQNQVEVSDLYLVGQ